MGQLGQWDRRDHRGRRVQRELQVAQDLLARIHNHLEAAERDLRALRGVLERLEAQVPPDRPEQLEQPVRRVNKDPLDSPGVQGLLERQEP